MPSDINNRLEALKRGYRRDNNLDPSRAVVASKNGAIYDPDIPGNVFVRVQTSNGLSGIRSVGGPAQTIYLYPGLNVKLGFDDRQQQFIDKVNTQAQFAANANPNWTSQPPQPRITQDFIETLAVVPMSPPSLTVGIKAWNPIVNGTYYEFPGTLVDFTGSLPATGSMYYGSIFVQNDYVHGEVKFSTQRNIADVPLNSDDVQETINARSSGSTPVYAIKLIGGQSSITLADIQNDGKTLQQLVNVGDTPIGAILPVNVTVRVVTAAGAVTVTTSDYVVVVNKTVGAATTVNLPVSPATGDTYVIKDGKGDAGANNITLTPAAGNIDGAGTKVMATNYQSISLVYNGTEWNVV